MFARLYFGFATVCNCQQHDRSGDPMAVPRGVLESGRILEVSNVV